MKSSLLLLTIFVGKIALASDFVVQDPRVQLKDVAVPIQSISCERGPFGTGLLKVVLSQAIGNPKQKGVLKSKFMDNDLGYSACTDVLKSLGKLVDAAGNIPLELKVIERSVVRIADSKIPGCEGAQQEIVSTRIEGIAVTESIYDSSEVLACPEGLGSYQIQSRDLVIYVLHENGIPTEAGF